MELAELPDKSAALLMVCAMGRNMGDEGAYYQCTQVSRQVSLAGSLAAYSCRGPNWPHLTQPAAARRVL